jgi:thioredoxin-dependent peroxiredoxin
VSRLRTILTTIATVIIGIVHATTQRNQSTVQLRAGDIAPDFTLPGSDGRTYRLRDFAGRTVVIAWFPKAFTGG